LHLKSTSQKAAAMFIAIDLAVAHRFRGVDPLGRLPRGTP
jgi:hypothetical protein